MNVKPDRTNSCKVLFHRNGQAKPPANGLPLDPVLDGDAPSQSKASAEPETNGRAANGRFAVGNKCAKGNPFARRMAQLRSALLESATPERLKALGDNLYKAALAGHWEAAKLWLAYCVGRPGEVVNPDTLDLEEFRLLDANPSRARILRLMLEGVPAALGSECAGGFLPSNVDEANAKILPKDENVRRVLEHQIAAEQKARVGRK